MITAIYDVDTENASDSTSAAAASSYIIPLANLASSLELFAKDFINSSHRQAKFPRVFTLKEMGGGGGGGGRYGDEHRLHELKVAMLMIEAALPLGCCSSANWNESKAYKWIWNVKQATDVVTLTELFIVLEESMENGWFVPGTLTNLYKTLPCRVDATLSSSSNLSPSLNYGSTLAMRIFTFDRIFQYDKVTLPSDGLSSSSSSSNNNNNNNNAVYVNCGSSSRLAILRKTSLSINQVAAATKVAGGNKVKTRGSLTPPVS
jgi:hypothetical protein